jgi:hypothetical protein
LTSFDLKTCTNCHTQQDAAYMTGHQEQFGSGCLSCHDGVDRLSNFDHNSFFPLDGKHAAAQCETCHAGKVYRGTPAECFQCHEEPEIHTGVFGQRCAYCHTTDVWSPATLRQHGFPLNHGLDDPNMLLQCDTCHGANYFDYTCYACHEHQQDEITNSHTGAGIVEADLPVCAKCHPAGVIDKTMQVP